MAEINLGSRAETVLNLMRDVFRGLSQYQEDAFLHTELSMAQVKALLAIGKDGDPSVGVVAKELDIGLSSASQVVERLVKAGLVERRPHPHDRRMTQCVLTPQGEALRRRFQAGPRLIREWLERLTPEELTQLEYGLGALARVAAESQREGDGYHGHQ
ncbi:MAG: MarR family winged helix-turn-helix transcriptional regulator [Firmicutes bacterium]|jgi:DNA-binding MarR family transcriptional regulator|nr:MarR family winged helix-turn-helix transcriptional regulator [Bacillota bacterium]